MPFSSAWLDPDMQVTDIDGLSKVSDISRVCSQWLVFQIRLCNPKTATREASRRDLMHPVLVAAALIAGETGLPANEFYLHMTFLFISSANEGKGKGIQ